MSLLLNFKKNTMPGFLSAALPAVVSGVSTALTNRGNKKFSEKMYERQKQDNLAFWKMQNEYNSPQAQRQRLEEAGFNPAMMYGSKAAPGNASPINTPDVKPVNMRPVDGDNFDVLARYFDTKIRQAQVDNLKADNTVKKQEALLKAAQIESTVSGTDMSKFDLQFKRDLRSYNADMIREGVRKTRVDIDSTIKKTERDQAMHSPNMQIAAERILRERLGRSLDKAKIDNLLKDSKLKQQEFELAEDGIYKNDPMWLRVLIQNIDSIEQKLKSWKILF